MIGLHDRPVLVAATIDRHLLEGPVEVDLRPAVFNRGRSYDVGIS